MRLNQNRVVYSLLGLLPLLVGLVVGYLVVYGMANWPMKWVFVMVIGTAGLAGMIMLGTFSNRLQPALLILAILALPTFYGFTFGYREVTPFVTLANGFAINLAEIFLLFLAVIWFYNRWTSPSPTPVQYPNGWKLILILLALNFYSVLFVASEPYYGASMIYLQIKSILVLLFFTNYVRDEATLRVAGYAFAGVLVLEALVVYEQTLLGVIFTAENLGRNIELVSRAGIGEISRVAGTLGHPNSLAMYLNLILPWIFFMFLEEKPGLKRNFLLLAILLAASIELLSGSRGGWTGLVVAMGIGGFLWMRKHEKNLLVGFGVTSFVIIILFSIAFATSSTFRLRVVEGDEAAAEVRNPLMAVAKETIKANPVTGVGLDNYTKYMALHDRTTAHVATSYDQPVHNSYLLMAAETGLPSLILFLILMAVIYRDAYLLFSRRRGPASTLGLGVLCGMITWGIHSLVNQTAPWGEQTLWVIIGLLAAAQRLPDPAQDATRPATRPH